MKELSVFIASVKSRMEACGVSRLRLACRLEVYPSFITKTLKGDTNLSVETMAKIANALGCELVIDIRPIEKDSKP